MKLDEPESVSGPGGDHPEEQTLSSVQQEVPATARKIYNSFAGSPRPTMQGRTESIFHGRNNRNDALDPDVARPVGYHAKTSKSNCVAQRLIAIGSKEATIV